MYVTTSRDPSAKARRFARALASFLSIPYFNRGKQKPGDEEICLVVTEDHGNPVALVKRYGEREEKLGFRLSGDLVKKVSQGRAPNVVGEAEAAGRIAGFLELEFMESADTSQGRIILVQPDRIDFMDRGEIVFRLKI